MEPQILHILSKGTLCRDGNTILFYNAGEHYKMPVNTISGIAVYEKTNLTSQALDILLRKGVPVHFFSGSGKYLGTLLPFSMNNEVGKVVLKQAEFVNNDAKRGEIACEIVESIRHNMLKLMEQHSDATEIKAEIEEIKIKERTPEYARSAEAEMWIKFYEFVSNCIKNFEFKCRTKNPPRDEVNAMISFGNALLYGTVTEEGLKTSLNLSLSFLHESWHLKRFSLVFDIADIFKPAIVHKLILRLANKRMIRKEHFEMNENGCYLNRTGKQIFISEYEKMLGNTHFNEEINRNSSYRHLIRWEFYKLTNHVLGKKKYCGYKGG